MKPIKVYSVVPKVPSRLEPLWELAYNYWFAWNDKITSLFSQLDMKHWRACDGNPVAFLNTLPQSILEDISRDEIYLERLQEALDSLRNYMSKTKCSITFPQTEGQPAVAYFSFEYGIDGSLPIYSGGLGILAGDHLKSASDLNIPLVGIGLAYNQGYFRQYLTPDGWQQERYPVYDFEQLPMQPVKDEAGEQVKISVDLAHGRKLHAQIWKVQVGRVALYLMDTNIAENEHDLRHLTDRLYGGNLETRLMQEILLGIGGVKTLYAVGIEPRVIHMNEGHAAFAALERIRLLMENHGLPFEAAQELVASSSVFTTHTPVPAGNDRFPEDLMRPYFESYGKKLGLAFPVFMALGREEPRNSSEQFCMTVLALRLSRFNNGVSKLHGVVSRDMWKKIWPSYPQEDIPIGSITNGVHMPTWVAPDLAQLYDRYLGPNWREDPDISRVWHQADNIPDAEFWRTHERLRERLVGYVRIRLRQQLMRKGARPRELEVADEVLDPQALTVCFARRFATYKRANLLLQDMARLKRLVSEAKRPVQFIFAGKAHPHDNEGKKLIQQIVQLSRQPEFRHTFVFIEDYDMDLAKHMVQGCDIWLNNPRRPLEASGTSGMKATANGVLNCSILDGWWDEAYQKNNSVGYAIGKGEEYDDLAYQDFVESQTLFNVLENDIVPDFYDRGHGNLPRGFIRRMKKSVAELGPVFNTHRMVEEYTSTAYLPAFRNFNLLKENEYAKAHELSAWRMEIMTNWSKLEIRNVQVEAPDMLFVGEPIVIQAEVYLNGLSAEDVQLQIYSGPLTHDGEFAKRRTSIMKAEETTEDDWTIYRGESAPMEAGRFGFTLRILPHHPLLLDPHSLGVIKWVNAS
jgi:starch phosphorylase